MAREHFGLLADWLRPACSLLAACSRLARGWFAACSRLARCRLAACLRLTCGLLAAGSRLARGLLAAPYLAARYLTARNKLACSRLALACLVVCLLPDSTRSDVSLCVQVVICQRYDTFRGHSFAVPLLSLLLFHCPGELLIIDERSSSHAGLFTGWVSPATF